MSISLRISWLVGQDQDAMSEAIEEVGRLTQVQDSAAYRLTGGGEDMQLLGENLNRVASDETRAPDYLILSKFRNGAEMLDAENPLREIEVTLSHQVILRAGYVYFTGADGSEPASDERFAPAIQLGTFNMETVEDELALEMWYKSFRFPEFAAMPGTRRVSRWYSVWGPIKGAVLYEFASLEDRLEHFEKPMEVHAMNPDHPTGSIVARTRHAWVSPSIGYRI